MTYITRTAQAYSTSSHAELLLIAQISNMSRNLKNHPLEADSAKILCHGTCMLPSARSPSTTLWSFIAGVREVQLKVVSVSLRHKEFKKRDNCMRPIIKRTKNSHANTMKDSRKKKKHQERNLIQYGKAQSRALQPQINRSQWTCLKEKSYPPNHVLYTL